MNPQSPGDKSLSLKICPLFTYSIYYRELCRHFLEEGRLCAQDWFLWGWFFVWRNFQGWAFRGRFYTGPIWHNSCRKNSFYFSDLSLPIHFCMWRCSGGIVKGEFSAYLDFQKRILRKGGISGAIEKQLEFKFFCKWKYVKDNFSGWIFCKKF